MRLGGGGRVGFRDRVRRFFLRVDTRVGLLFGPLFFLLAIDLAGSFHLGLLLRDGALQRFGEGLVDEPVGCGRLTLIGAFRGRFVEGLLCRGLLLAHLLELFIRDHLDVELPLTELRGQTHVLAALADGERLLIILDVDRRAAILEIEVYRRDLGRLQRVHDQDLDRLVPAYDVDLLAEELVDDVLDARAAYTDTGSDTVDVVVVRGHRDFRAVAGLTGDLFDLDDLVGDLRHLELEERSDDHRVRAREG